MGGGGFNLTHSNFEDLETFCSLNCRPNHRCPNTCVWNRAWIIITTKMIPWGGITILGIFGKHKLSLKVSWTGNIELTLSLSFSGLPDSSIGKESTCNAGNPCLIPGSGRSPGEGKGYPLQEQSMGPQRVGQDRVTFTLSFNFGSVCNGWMSGILNLGGIVHLIS